MTNCSGVCALPSSRESHSFVLLTPTNAPIAQALGYHGFLCNERGRAGTYVQGHREEAGPCTAEAIPTLLEQQPVLKRAFAPSQMQDFMRMYSSLVERCFTSCCNDFTSKALSGKEVSNIRGLSAFRRSAPRRRTAHTTVRKF